MEDRGEITAWRWLLALPRLDYKTHSWQQQKNQIVVRMCPGTLAASQGAPMVYLSISYPGLKKRIITSGNSLYDAAHKAHQDLWNYHSIHLPFLHEFDPTRQLP